MIFDSRPPSFQEILGRLSVLESIINTGEPPGNDTVLATLRRSTG